MANPLYAAMHYLGRWLFIEAFSLRVYGREFLPSTGGAVIASNHQSFLDPVILGIAADRPLCYLARGTLFRNLLFGRFIRMLGAIDFARDGIGASGMKKMTGILRDGKLVVMFPEGTRTRDGSIGTVRPGVGLIARRAGVPVVPAVIDGAFKAWPRTRKLPQVHPVRVAFGEPLEAGGGKRMHVELAARMDALLKTLRRKQW
jgi:1-acyl-sn-glycerol-3-phosphate acyltransferase